jgi:glycosyltransferase involved in cell wall biosynthesis
MAADVAPAPWALGPRGYGDGDGRRDDGRRGPNVRVAYVTMQFPAPSETFASQDVRTLAMSGVDVEVFALRPPAARHEAMLEERSLVGIPVHTMPLRRVARGLRLWLARPRWAASLLTWILVSQLHRPSQLARSLALATGALVAFEEMQRRRFDVVHLFWGHYPALVGHLVAQFLPEVRLSVFLGAYDLRATYPGSGSVARRADVVWTHADANLPAILSLGVAPDRLRVNYRGIDVDAARRIAAEEAERRVRHRIVTVGRLLPAKGVDDVLRAVAQLRERLPDATLVVAGDGPDRVRLEDLARELGIDGAVTFLGHVPQNRVWRELARADAFVLMSHEERLPNAAKEAMALGCVPFVTRTAGIEELVEDGRTGHVVEIHDVPALVGRLSDLLLQDAAALASMRERAQAHVSAHFDVRASMANYVRAWQGLVTGR